MWQQFDDLTTDGYRPNNSRKTACGAVSELGRRSAVLYGRTDECNFFRDQRLQACDPDPEPIFAVF
ncbi:MAG: hypothetical protein H7315_00965 [Herminiimonas sp.]|nr:hypothetical protein [Herminiimonas sp.]